MKSWWKEKREIIRLFLQDYGKIFIAGIGLSIVFMSVGLIISLVSPHTLRVSFLDVGQGDAILVQTPSGHDMLIDGGASDAVLARLSEDMSYFDRQLDVMIATHDDADHITGLIPVLQKFDVDAIVTSPIRSSTEIADDLHARVDEERGSHHIGAKGDMIDFGDGVIVRVLYPDKTVSSKIDTNDASVSVIITYGDHSFLLTGDLTSKYESRLFGNNLPMQVTVFKAGHHGSKTSSGEQLLTYVKPEYAIISAGKDNRYGHPNSEAVDRLEKYAKEILSTIDRGTITFASDGRMLSVETEK